MQTRNPIVAGQFYPARKSQCITEIEECLEQRTSGEKLPKTIVAGIVPHAGWAFSGDLSAMVLSAVKHRHEVVDSFVIFGAAHSYTNTLPGVYDQGRWQTPMGDIEIDTELAEAVLKTGKARPDVNVHGREHSIEVQVPFIQYLFADAKLLPIVVPPDESGIALGKAVGDIIKANDDKKIVCLGSTDLTHYGPRYGFTPMGADTKGLKWASMVNDQAFIDLAVAMDESQLLESSIKKSNACGPGAAAATIAAAKQQGKTKGYMLAHTNSNDIMMKKMGSQSTDSVGYAAIVY